MRTHFMFPKVIHVFVFLLHSFKGNFVCNFYRLFSFSEIVFDLQMMHGFEKCLTCK